MGRVRASVDRFCRLVLGRREDLREELAAHVQFHIDDNVRAGMTPEEARRAALLTLGGVEPTREVYHHRQGVPSVEAFLREAKCALRGLARRPGFSAAAVATLALGIGGTTAVFSVVDTLLIRPLPFPNADRLVGLSVEQASGLRTPAVTRAAFEAIREQGVFAATEGYQFGAATLTGAGEPVLVSAPRVSPGLLSMLGVVPQRGRVFEERDTARDERVVLISDGLWSRRFGNAADIVGRQLLIDDEPHEIVGVLPAGFAFPERRVEVWRPLLRSAGPLPGFVQTVAMLPPGTPRPAAVGRLDAMSGGLRDAGVLPAGRRLVIEDLIQRRYGREYSTALYAMLGAVFVVLLVACVNVASLLLARAVARQDQFAVMAALGASRVRLAMAPMTEGLALAMLGGAVGWLVARGLLAAILTLLPPRMTMLSTDVTLDGRVAAFTVGLTMLACLGAALVPTLRVTGIRFALSAHRREHGVSDRVGEGWQSALIVAQLALVLILLTGAGLLLRSFVRLVDVTPGFDTADLLLFQIQLPEGRYTGPGVSLGLFEELDRMVEVVPGVRRVSFSEGAPPDGVSISFDIVPEADGQPRVDATGQEVAHPTVAPDYFTTMGIALLEGRTFLPDDPEDVVIINEVVARRYWGGQSPLGRRFRLHADRPWWTVIGVAADVKQMGLADRYGSMELYRPYGRKGRGSAVTFVVRADGDHAVVTRQVKERMWAVDPGIPFIETQTMDQRLAASVDRPRFFFRLSMLFAGVAILLAAVGVYGTATYWVTRRQHELAVRVALGATRGDIRRLVVGRSLRLAGWGCTAGMVGALLAANTLDALLFETSPREPVVLVSVTAFLVGIVLVACYLPAFKASRLDPAVLLRSE